MKVNDTADWADYDEGELSFQFAETDDPRVVAVIQRDNGDTQISQLYDGDAINPIIYVEHRYGLSFNWVAGYDGGEAALMERAYETWGWGETARRWLWIFHSIAFEEVGDSYDRDGNWIVATSHAYREHCGIPEAATYEGALEDVRAIQEDLQYALDGDVFGIGWAVNEGGRLPDEPIDLGDGNWGIDIQCWGFVGERYARQSAGDFDFGGPDLPAMLELEV